MIFHLAVSSYIARTGTGAPWALAPTDVLTRSGTMFYPAGFHLLAGAATQVTGNVVVSVNALALLLVGIGMPLGRACLTAALARANGFARDTTMGAAGVASILTATLYRPGVQLAHDGGILPNSVALALSAGILAALVSWRRVPRTVLIGAGLAVAGAVIVHPSALVTVGVSSLSSISSSTCCAVGGATCAGSCGSSGPRRCSRPWSRCPLWSSGRQRWRPLPPSVRKHRTARSHSPSARPSPSRTAAISTWPAPALRWRPRS